MRLARLAAVAPTAAAQTVGVRWGSPRWGAAATPGQPPTIVNVVETVAERRLAAVVSWALRR